MISKFNHEGYPDPTPYEALKTGRFSYRPFVYICSPSAGDVDANIQKTRQYCRFAVGKGYIPLAPHLIFTQFLDDRKEDERALGMFFGCALMSKCAEIWVCGDTISSGMEQEIQRAKRKGYRLRYFNSQLKEEE